MLRITIKYLVIIALTVITGSSDISYQPKLDAATLAYAEETLGETQQVRDATLNEITSWIESETAKGKFTAITDPQWILSFLRLNRFDAKKTKEHIRNYLKFRTSTPEWYQNRDPLKSPLKEIFRLGTSLPLKNRDKQGRIVLLYRVAGYNPAKFDLADLFRAQAMIFDLLVKDVEQSTIQGIVFVADFDNFTIHHALQMTPTVLQKVATLWSVTNCRTVSAEAFHAPPVIELTANIVKSLLGSRLKNTITVHPAGVDLHNVISKNILPVEYGGTAGTLNDLTEYWYNKCVEERDWLIDTEKMKYNTT